MAGPGLPWRWRRADLQGAGKDGRDEAEKGKLG